jgi:hypothetical protein
MSCQRTHTLWPIPATNHEDPTSTGVLAAQQRTQEGLQRAPCIDSGRAYKARAVSVCCLGLNPCTARVGKQIEADNRWAAHCQLPYHSLLLIRYGLTSCCTRTSLLQSLSAEAEGSWMMVMPLQETDSQRNRSRVT